MPRRKLTRREAQDLVALLLLSVGGGGLIATAFVWRTLAGWAVVFLILIATGIVNGME